MKTVESIVYYHINYRFDCDDKILIHKRVSETKKSVTFKVSTTNQDSILPCLKKSKLPSDFERYCRNTYNIVDMYVRWNCKIFSHYKILILLKMQ